MSDDEPHEIVEHTDQSLGWSFVYDEAEDDAEYSRAFLNETRLAAVKSQEPWPIEKIRSEVMTNIVKTNQDTRGETLSIDPEIIHYIDVHTNIPIFITGDNVFTREELCEFHPFAALRQTPESVFAQQELGLFVLPPPDDPEILARDLGDPSPFMLVPDLVRSAIKGTDCDAVPPTRIVKTKVFIGRDRWKRFQEACKMFAYTKDFIMPALADGKNTLFSLVDRVTEDSPTLRLGDGRGLGGGGGKPRAPLLLGDGSDLRERELGLREREATLRERELAVREREAALREREAGLRGVKDAAGAADEKSAD